MDPHSRGAKKNTSHERRCYRKILRMSYKDHVTNEEVCVKVQHAIEPHEDLLIIVKRRKLKWNEYISRSSGLAETILQGIVKGSRRRGRQKKRGGKSTSGNEKAWSSLSPRRQWTTKKKEETGCEFICGTRTTPAVTG